MQLFAVNREMVRAAKPNYQQRLGVVGVVGLGIWIGADLARFSDDCAALNINVYVTSGVSLESRHGCHRIRFSPFAHVFGVMNPAVALARARWVIAQGTRHWGKHRPPGVTPWRDR